MSSPPAPTDHLLLANEKSGNPKVKVDRSNFAPASKKALDREMRAKAAFQSLVETFHKSGIASQLEPGTKHAMALLNPSCHLTGHCWATFRKFVLENYPNFTVVRTVASAEEKKAAKETRKGPVYFVSAIYKAPGKARRAAKTKTTSHAKIKAPPLPMPGKMAPPKPSNMAPPTQQQPSRALFPTLLLPAGALKVTIGNPEERTEGHVWIKSLGADSPLRGQLAVGDWLVFLNGIPVRYKDSMYCAGILQATAASDLRTIQVARAIETARPVLAAAAQANPNGIAHPPVAAVKEENPVANESAEEAANKKILAAAVVTKPSTAATTNESSIIAKENPAVMVTIASNTTTTSTAATTTTTNHAPASLVSNEKQLAPDADERAPKKPKLGDSTNGDISAAVAAERVSVSGA